MYIPQRFRGEDREEALLLIRNNPFATLITVQDGEPFLSHVPLIAKKVEGRIELIGHLSRANPHWRSLAQAPALAVFNGPHTYITPKWYTENDVPTWNYSVVHAKGDAELVEDYAGIVQCLKDLTAHVESVWPSGWDFSVPSDLPPDVLPKSIVGFRIRVREIDFKKKLSQNRSPEDRAGVLRGLTTRNDEASRGVLRDMLNLYSTHGNLK